MEQKLALLASVRTSYIGMMAWEEVEILGAL
jgi:hypothetical protein